MVKDESSYRQLLISLAGWAIAHLLASVTLLTLLHGGIDLDRSFAARAAYVASHPVRWRLGWLPWQLSAVSDVIVSVALWRWLTQRPGRGGAAVAAAGIVLCLLAVVADQWSEYTLTTRYVADAQLLVDGRADGAALARREWQLLFASGVVANALYAAMAATWASAVILAARRARQGFGSIAIVASAAVAALCASSWAYFEALHGRGRHVVAEACGGIGFAAFFVALGLMARRVERLQSHAGAEAAS
jgi:hypothetical protein